MKALKSSEVDSVRVGEKFKDSSASSSESDDSESESEEEKYLREFSKNCRKGVPKKKKKYRKA